MWIEQLNVTIAEGLHAAKQVLMLEKLHPAVGPSSPVPPGPAFAPSPLGGPVGPVAMQVMVAGAAAPFCFLYGENAV